MQKTCLLFSRRRLQTRRSNTKSTPRANSPTHPNFNPTLTGCLLSRCHHLRSHRSLPFLPYMIPTLVIPFQARRAFIYPYPPFLSSRRRPQARNNYIHPMMVLTKCVGLHPLPPTQGLQNIHDPELVVSAPARCTSPYPRRL
jgi:hypothetical protein